MWMCSAARFETLCLIPIPELCVLGSAIRFQHDAPSGDIIVAVNATRSVDDECGTKFLWRRIVSPHKADSYHWSGISHVGFRDAFLVRAAQILFIEETRGQGIVAPDVAIVLRICRNK